MSIFNFYRESCRERGFSLPEILVVVAILGVLAAIAIPVSLNQQSKAADASIKSDLTTVAAGIETELLGWRGAPPDTLNICHTYEVYPSSTQPPNRCDDGEWEARKSNNSALDNPLGGRVSAGVVVQGIVAEDGSYCLDGSSSKPGTKKFYYDSQSSQVAEGTCHSVSWTPTGSLVGSTGATTVPGDLPAPPTGVAVDVPEVGSTATVKWNAQAGVTYIVKVTNEPAKTFTASTTGVASCVFPAETCEGPATGNLLVGTYTAIVRSGNNEGWGAGATQDFKIETQGGTGSATLERIAPPGEPTVSQSGADINVSWARPTGVPDGEEIIKYRVSWSLDGTEWIGEIETGSNRTTHKILGASFESGETYFFRVQAMSDSGILGKPSQTSEAFNYIVSKPAPPALPYSVPGLYKVDLFWTGSASNAYLISLRPDAGVIGNPVCTTAAESNCSVTVSSLANGTPYVFKIQARDTAGVLSDPVSITGTPTAAVPPSAPLNPVVNVGPASRQLTLTWKPPFTNGGAPVIQYQIQWSTTGADSDWNDTNSIILEERNVSFDATNSIYSYIFNNLTPSTRYYYRLIAINSQGFGGASNTVSGVPFTPAPTVAATAYDTNVVLTWPRVTGDTRGYIIYRDGGQLATVGTGTTSYRATGLTNGRGYTFTVRAVNSDGRAGDMSSNVNSTPQKIASGGSERTFVANGSNGTAGKTYRVHTYYYVGGAWQSLSMFRNYQVEVLAVGAGGGGGGNDGPAGGGGGGGGAVVGRFNLNAGTATIGVGGGGDYGRWCYGYAPGGGGGWPYGARGGNAGGGGCSAGGGGGGGLTGMYQGPWLIVAGGGAGGGGSNEGPANDYPAGGGGDQWRGANGTSLSGQTGIDYGGDGGGGGGGGGGHYGGARNWGSSGGGNYVRSGVISRVNGGRGGVSGNRAAGARAVSPQASWFGYGNNYGSGGVGDGGRGEAGILFVRYLLDP